MNFDYFILSPRDNRAWIREKHIDVYVRKSTRIINDEIFLALDLAAIQVDENMRGKGIFSKFLNRFENVAKSSNRIVYVESILEPKLEKFLLKRGYKKVPHSADIAPNMYKIV